LLPKTCYTTTRGRDDQKRAEDIKLVDQKVFGPPVLLGDFLASRDFGVKLVYDFLRDLSLDCKNIGQIAIVFLRPNVRVAARVNQLGIQMDPACIPTYASFQHVRNPKRITDLARIASATVWHHARAADHLKISNLRQLGQNVVLHTIGKKRVVFVFTQVLKWQHGDSSCYRTEDQ